MHRLSNEPEAFASEAARGFSLAHRDVVRAVPGGVRRLHDSAEPTVAVVTGGGSGHYPAFAGLVGPGLASAAVLGNIFASPSATQVADVGEAADQGRGVLFVYGNYAGDVLNFDEGQQRLRERGIAAESVQVTDDISSAPSSAAHLRRGVAGDLVVLKVAAGAAWSGLNLEDVADAARRANSATRTLGVAFSGCTLPGATRPLFDVPSGRMAVGMGIHGEPGVREVDRLTARELAGLLVESLLEEQPIDSVGRRAVVILNGLGSTKLEELFVLWGEVSDALDVRGVEVANVEVGELVTSFDMAGVSLTLSWLSEDLLRWWSDPCQSPAFTRGASHLETRQAEVAMPHVVPEVRAAAAGQALESSRRVAALAQVVDDRLAAIEWRLGELDAVAGDGDHGIGMRRGSRAAASAAADAAAAGLGPATTLRAAAAAWGDEAGGTSGALWAAGLAALADALPDDRLPTSDELARGVEVAVEAVRVRGGAAPGDKTMVDALVPFADTLSQSAGAGIRASVGQAAVAAAAGAEATSSMVARLGRSRTHQERSLGHPDPGAVSFAEVVAALSESEG